MTTTDRLLAAQTARAAAKRAFNAAFSDAVSSSIARGLRTPEQIDAAVEADPAVIAARAASQVAIAELEAAQAAMKADAAVSDEDRAYAEERRAVEMARAMTESAPVATPAEIAQHEQDEEDGIERSAPVAPQSRVSEGPVTLDASDIAALSPQQAEALADVLTDLMQHAYTEINGRPCVGPGSRQGDLDAAAAERAHDRKVYDRIAPIKTALRQRARATV